ncbi:MAG: M12 family metallo-peptidase [Weeksellaceae bacterium]|nr:M12 family metallo-peptidase [Weeksellaceae bacterium]
MKKVLLALAFAMPLVGFSQWKAANVGNAEIKAGKENIKAAGFYSFDSQLFKQKLVNAPDRFSGQPGNMISIPNANGEMEKFEVWEASNFASALQEKFPEIKSYVGIGVDNPNAYLRFSLSPSGIETMTLKVGNSEFIEPYTTDGAIYIVFDSKEHRNLGDVPFECSTEATSALSTEVTDLVSSSKANNGVFKTLRLAMSCTGEYAQYFGGTVAGAMAAINNTMTRVNGVFERDFAVQLILIGNNEDVIYTNSSTDPYTNPDSVNTTQTQLRNTLNSVIGVNNYDIGHIFHYSSSSPNGNAGCIGCVCDANKGTGYTAANTNYGVPPQGDYWDIDYVAHEMGHQLGANHTFSFNWEGTGANVEPGSGSTIMSYAGITSFNVQSHSDDYFAYKSIAQVQSNLQSKPCVVNIPLTNQAPIVDAGPNYNVPKGTAFKLTGTATDPNNDPLVYSWEQYDSGNSNTTSGNSRVSFTKNIGPNFRSKPYIEEPVRYMPAFEHVLARQVDETEAWWRSKWEAITTVTRVFNFTFTAKDNNPEGGQTNTALMKVTVRNEGPFKITNPIENQQVDITSGTMLLEWDVAGTDGGLINTSDVRILLSTDNGTTFTEIVASTPNDGSETIALPAGTVAGNEVRIMIEAIDNIYYAVTRKFRFTGQMGLNDLEDFVVGIFPNPSDGTFYVRSGNVASGNVITNIYDTSGKLVYTQEKVHFGGTLNNSYQVKLPAGVYVLTIKSESGITTQKLIIK